MTFDTWKRWALRDFHLASLSADMWSVAMLMVANGFPVCFGNHGGDIDGESIDKSAKLSRDDQPIKRSVFLEENIDVTIRLEEGFIRHLWGPRCIVTIYNPASHARTAGHDVRGAGDDE